MSNGASDIGEPDVRRVPGRELAPGMTLFDAEDNPREILEIGDHRQHAHPEVSDYRMAKCPGGWSIMVFDREIYRISNGPQAGDDGRAREVGPR